MIEVDWLALDFLGKIKSDQKSISPDSIKCKSIIFNRGSNGKPWKKYFVRFWSILLHQPSPPSGLSFQVVAIQWSVGVRVSRTAQKRLWNPVSRNCSIRYSIRRWNFCNQTVCNFYNCKLLFNDNDVPILGHKIQTQGGILTRIVPLQNLFGHWSFFSREEMQGCIFHSNCHAIGQYIVHVVDL